MATDPIIGRNGRRARLVAQLFRRSFQPRERPAMPATINVNKKPSVTTTQDDHVRFAIATDRYLTSIRADFKN
jgi:hypothetical protein